MYSTPTEIQTIDLYAVGSEEPDEFEINPFPEVPFMHSIALKGIKGRIVHVQGMFNSGMMVNAMCSSIYENVKHKLPTLHASKHRLRMANGSVIPSMGLWIGHVSMGRSTVICSFEVFPSRGSWAFLVGKPMQCSFGTIHDHATNKISIPGDTEHKILTNQIHYKHAVDMLTFIRLRPTADVKQ
jgi:hypothetical protein